MGLGLCPCGVQGQMVMLVLTTCIATGMVQTTDGRHSRLTPSHDCVAEAVACFRLNHATGNLS